MPLSQIAQNFARIYILTDMYWFNPYLSIDPNKLYHAHANTDKPAY